MTLRGRTRLLLCALLLAGCRGCDAPAGSASGPTPPAIQAPFACWGKIAAGDATAPAALALDLADGAGISSGGRALLGSSQGPLCARTRAGLACFGAAAPGHDESSAPRPLRLVPDAIAVAFGLRHACAIRADRSVACWGANLVGQLGDGAAPAPQTKVGLRLKRTGAGTGVDVVGRLPAGSASAAPVPVTGLQGAVELALGSSHSCARVASGAVLCWGGGSRGELGDGRRETSDRPVAVSGLSDAIGIAASQAWSCAVRRDGSVVCWGTQDLYPRSGAPVVSATPTPIAGLSQVEQIVLRMIGASDSGNVGFARGRDGRVSRFGDGPPAQLGIASAVQLATGVHHTCARIADGGVRCWGSNDYRGLGLTSDEPASGPLAVPGISGAIELAAGATFSCVRRAAAPGR